MDIAAARLLAPRARAAGAASPALPIMRRPGPRRACWSSRRIRTMRACAARGCCSARAPTARPSGSSGSRPATASSSTRCWSSTRSGPGRRTCSSSAHSACGSACRRRRARRAARTSTCSVIRIGAWSRCWGFHARTYRSDTPAEQRALSAGAEPGCRLHRRQSRARPRARAGRYRPTLVLAPAPQDLHPDHHASGELARRLLERRGELGTCATGSCMHGAGRCRSVTTPGSALEPPAAAATCAGRSSR